MKFKAEQKQNKQNEIIHKKRKINYNNNITDLVEINDKEIKYNTPLRIKFNNKYYNITTRNYLDKLEVTWKCIYNRKTKDKPDNYKNFCNGTIKGFRDLFSKKNFNFYLKEEHSTLWEEFENKLITVNKYNNKINIKENENNKIVISDKFSIDNINKKDQIIKDSINNNNILSDTNYKNISNDSNKVNIVKEKNSDMIQNEKTKNEYSINKSFINKAKNIKTQNEIDELMLNECKENKIYLSKQSKFIRTFKRFYAENSIDIKPFHLKYLFNKYKKICYPKTIDEIFEYSKEIKDLGFFCRDISINNIYTNDK